MNPNKVMLAQAPVAMAKKNCQGPQPQHSKAHRAPRSKSLKHKPHNPPIPQAQTAKLNRAMAFLETRASRTESEMRIENAQHQLQPPFQQGEK
jgi:hypothetical protein